MNEMLFSMEMINRFRFNVDSRDVSSYLSLICLTIIICNTWALWALCSAVCVHALNALGSCYTASTPDIRVLWADCKLSNEASAASSAFVTLLEIHPSSQLEPLYSTIVVSLKGRKKPASWAKMDSVSRRWLSRIVTLALDVTIETFDDMMSQTPEALPEDDLQNVDTRRAISTQ